MGILRLSKFNFFRGAAKIASLASVILILASGFPVGAEPVITEDAYILKPKDFELRERTNYTVYGDEEWDSDYDKQNQLAGYEETELVTSLEFAGGVTDKIELGIVLPWLSKDKTPKSSLPEESDSGLGDVKLKLKYRLDEAGSTIPITSAFGLQIDLPTGEDEPDPGDLATGSGLLGLTAIFYLTEERSKEILGHLNLGYTYTPHDDTFFGNYAIERILNEKLTLVGELNARAIDDGAFWDLVRLSADKKLLSLTGGLLYSPAGLRNLVIETAIQYRLVGKGESEALMYIGGVRYSF